LTIRAIGAIRKENATPFQFENGAMGNGQRLVEDGSGGAIAAGFGRA